MTIHNRPTPLTVNRSASNISSRDRVACRKEVSLQKTEVVSENRTFYFTPHVSQEDSSSASHSITPTTNLGQKRPYSQSATDLTSSYKRSFAELIPQMGAEPDWESNPGCFAYLQGAYQHGQSKYLSKNKDSDESRAGYVIGRHEEKCDVVVEDISVSREHCLIYMETGSNGVNKGIRIYLECLSNSGVWIDKQFVKVGERIMLKGGNKISLYKRNHEPVTFFTVRFPPVFEANACEHEYQFTKELGKGNFAVVYHAYSRNTNKSVAIKVISKAYFDSKPNLLKPIVQEMSIMMQMAKHPFLVEMKEVFNEKRRIFLVIEYIPDGELFNCIKDMNMLTENEARFVFWQLLNAIRYLHRLDVAHRDIKPENVLIHNKDNLHIKVSDFGLAKKQNQELFGTQCGTVNYVAPEVLDPRGVRAYTLKCDMWSIGVMLYVCLCGFAPFSDEYAPPSMEAQIKMGKFEFPSPYWDKISDEAKELVSALLTVDPNERASADEALGMPWMNLEAEDLEERKMGLGEEILDKIDRLNNHAELDPTQKQTQMVSLD
ncbi:hypothetical protein INT47_007430 [Mucor saturninus]|uniref:Uncharacterized protein n=1 Tax=Mucor saturninus TaxID=64648 RepID=A0A8H7R1E3_9FUNG|nr:hypothetical protein INT47_007430 [Mucor saturninus]